MELPEKFLLKMKEILPNDYDEFIKSLENESQKGITINTNKISNIFFEKNFDNNFEKIADIPNGYYVSNFKFGKNIFNHLGLIYSQEPSAMYPVELLNIKENDLVLDVCASPGGKSIQILEKLNNTGLLISNEIIYNRAKILYENLNRMGFKNFAITCNSPNDFTNLDIKFDKILVDAPCGGEGMFRKNNFDFNSYKQINTDTNSKRQLSILNCIKNLLKDGGKLVYSTCTYDTKENEFVIEKFLDENKEFKLVKVKGFEKSLSNGISKNKYIKENVYRRYPHLHKGEGQFMAVLEKNGNDINTYFEDFKSKNFQILNKKDKQFLENSFKNIADITGLNFVKKNDTYFVLPKNNIDFDNLNLLNIGTLVGTKVKDNFKISHNFYKTYYDKFYNRIELNKEDCEEYLKGIELNTTNKNSISILTYLNQPLGGGKIVNGKIKNYYPKELRNK